MCRGGASHGQNSTATEYTTPKLDTLKRVEIVEPSGAVPRVSESDWPLRYCRPSEPRNMLVRALIPTVSFCRFTLVNAVSLAPTGERSVA